MKLFDAIKAKQMDRIAPITRFACIDPQYEAKLSLDSPTPDHYQWRIGAEISCVLSGPIKAREQLMKQAHRMIAKEVYGEIIDDLIELQRILYEEQYRADGDPVFDAIRKMINKMQGE